MPSLLEAFPVRRQYCGRRPIQLYLSARTKAIAENDLAQISRAATEGSDRPNRSRVLKLAHSPLSVRLKGINPATNYGKEVAPHTGRGYVSRPVVAAENALIIGKPVLSPEGTMLLAEAQAEAAAALELGEEITDPVLGLGKYEDLIFSGQEVGFVIYELPATADFRLYDALAFIMLNLIGRAQDPAAVFALFPLVMEKAGRLMRRTHDLDKVHLFAHLNNFRTDFTAEDFPRFRLNPGTLRLVDLDHVRSTAGMARAQKAAWRYRDLCRPLVDLAQIVLVGRQFDSPVKLDLNLPLKNLIPDFLRGYAPDLRGPAASSAALMDESVRIAQNYLDLGSRARREEIPLIADGRPADYLMDYLLSSAGAA